VDTQPWHARRAIEVLADQRSHAGGLTEADAQQRRLHAGPNQLPPPPRISALRILAAQFASLVVGLLAAAAILSFFLGERLEAWAIAAVLALNAGLGFAIELKARRAMEALGEAKLGWCLAWRDGVLSRLDAVMLVPGDVVELELGRMVPADVRLLSASDLQLNEAALTGESMPVAKDPGARLDPDAILADRITMAYKGTLVVSGGGRGVVTATGAATEVGRIGTLMATLVSEPTPIERRLDALGRRLVWLTLAVATIVASLGLLQGLSIGRGVETAIALAVAAVPEGLPAVVTIALAIGLRRMAVRHALVRRLPAVESLGSATVVCTDKTRTLTSGDMTLTRVWTAGHDYRLEDEGPGSRTLDPQVRQAIALAMLASGVQPAGAGLARPGDPVDAALARAADQFTVDRAASAGTFASSIPFSSERRFMAVFHRTDSGLMVSVKGAPLRVLALCRRMVTDSGETTLDHKGRVHLLRINHGLAADGLHVLAIAHGHASRAEESAITGLTFVGFIGLLDPPAAGVRETIRRLSEAGLRTIMLTGDQRATARAVARALGLLSDDRDQLDGREVLTLSETALGEAVAHARVFSRVTPETKLSIVGALQQRGEIVAMLGDGVNDAAALKKADVGVAMGIRGSDVAKQAASIVLQDDRLETVAAAVEEGRIVYDNIRKFVFYLFSCNLAEILVLLAMGLLGIPPLLPLQILWLNLVTDTFPALALALEPGEPHVMRRPPRDPGEALLSREFLGEMIAYALLITATTLAAGVIVGHGSDARFGAAVFMTLALAQVFHLGNARGAGAVVRPSRAVANPYAVLAVLMATGLQAGAMHWAPAARLLRIEPFTLEDWYVVALLALVPAVMGQTVKLLRGAVEWRPSHARSLT